MSDTLEIWVDADIVPRQTRLGTLTNHRGSLRFQYHESWLSDDARFAIDPDLTLDAGVFHPGTAGANFRIFDDSAPDRWGQTLMRRREAMQARDALRSPRVLYAWDYLCGVQDTTRQGALRLRHPDSDRWLADEPLPAPPLARLRELESVATELTSREINDLDALRQWLAVLVAPGASLGGARPKANFTQPDGRLWIAKFPARDDERDIGAWEWVAHELAHAAGIHVPEAEVRQFSGKFHTYCVERFDRIGDRRRFYASAMAMLGRDRSEGSSYIDLAEFIRFHGARGSVEADLRELFRRAAFSIAVGNRDDHLRNHGFLMTAEGWRLSPAFDLNPAPEQAEHVLSFDGTTTQPDWHLLLSTAEWYGLTPAAARLEVEHVRDAVRPWREVARHAGIARADIEITAPAFNQA